MTGNAHRNHWFRETQYFTPEQIEAWVEAKIKAGIVFEQAFLRWLVLDLLFDRQDGRCAMCREELRGIHDFDLDHIQPTNRGGTGLVTNLQLLCVPCHRRKTREERR